MTEQENEEIPREDLVYRADVMKDQEVPEESIKFLRRAIALDPHLTENEQLLFAFPYRKIANRIRESLFHVHDVYYNENSPTESQAAALSILRESLITQLLNISSEVCTLVTELLLPNSQTSADKCVYHLIIADFSRYIAELDIEDSVPACESSFHNYQIAQEFAMQSLPAAHPTRLSICLNFAKLLHDVQGRKEQAIEVAQQAYNDGDTAISEITDISMLQSSKEILQMLKDDTIRWSCQ